MQSKQAWDKISHELRVTWGKEGHELVLITHNLCYIVPTEFQKGNESLLCLGWRVAQGEDKGEEEDVIIPSILGL